MAPDTVVYLDCRLDVHFKLGSEENKHSVTLDFCKAAIDDFKAKGNLSAALEGAFQFIGTAGLTSLVEQATYKVQADKSTVEGTVTSSDDGTSVVWNATLDVHTGSGNCRPYQISMDSVIPFVFDYNDTVVMTSVDRDRLQMEYKVSSWDRSCTDETESLEANKDVQRKLLKETNKEIEALLTGKEFSLKLPKDKWYGFKETQVQSVNGGLEFSFGMSLGRQKNVKVKNLKSVHNALYDKKVISYRFSDGQQFEVYVPVMTTNTAPISATSVPVLSTHLMMFCMVLVCCFALTSLNF